MNGDNEKKEKQIKKGDVVCMILFFMLTVACIVFSILCIHASGVSFFQRNSLWLSILASSLLSLICGLSVVSIVAKKDVIYKSVLSLYIFLLFCLILCYVLQKTGFFVVIKDSNSLQSYLERAGVWMPIFYILLQYLQVVILPIPSIVSTLAGVALFGAFRTVIYSLIGIILGSLTAFTIGRKLGNKAVSWIVGEETLEKWQKKLKGKDVLVLTLMFLLPLFPDDILCFVAGLSSISFPYFIVMIVVSRILAVTTTCYSINFIPMNTWWGILIWVVIAIVFIVGFVVIYKHLDAIQAALSKRFKRTKKQKKEKTKNK